jgi:hypothetical protein
MLDGPMRPITATVLASCVAFLACGGAPPKPANPNTLPIATATAKAAPAVDLSPVEMPASAVVLVHVSHAAASADVISDWASQPLDAGSILTEMVGKRIAAAVDLDSPADFLVMAKDRGAARDPDASFAVALGVKNFEAAKSMLEGDYGLLPLPNGAFEIQRGHGRHRDGDSDFRSCALAPAIGGARVVCSRNATTRDAALPYLTRGVARLASIKSDLHVEARPGPFHDMLRRERRHVVSHGARAMGGAYEMRAVWEAAVSDLIDGFLDTDAASLDANVDRKSGTAALTISASGSRGLVTRMLSAHPERAEPPPAAFFRLPGDADVAFFEHGLDADQLASPKAAILQAVTAGIDRENKLKDADRKAMLDALGRTIDLLSLPAVYARGVDYAKAVPAVAGLDDRSSAAKIRAAIEGAAGWDVIGVEGPPDRIAAVLKDWTKVVARPRVAVAMGHDAPTWRVTPARNAPRGSIHLAMRVSHDDYDWMAPRGKNGAPKKRPPIVLTMHTFIVPDHDRAWIVSALDESTAAAKARAIVSGASGTTLASRAGLEAMKTVRVNAGGFITPRGAGMGIPFTWLVGSPRYKATSDPLLGVSAQTQYTTPLVFTAAEGKTASARTLTLTARVPRAALTDVLAVAPRIFH